MALQHEGHVCVLQDWETAAAPHTESVPWVHDCDVAGLVPEQAESAKTEESYFRHVTERD